jgi:hypothetical protein
MAKDEAEEPAGDAEVTEVTEEKEEAPAARKGKKEKAQETAVEKKEEAPAEPAAPEMPSMKISQILPMAVMMGLQKYDLEELGWKHHAELGYITVQLLCLGVLFVVKGKIDGQEDDGKKIRVPEVKQMGQVVSPAVEQTPKEYDLAKWFEQAKQAVISFFILGGVYMKWGYLLPLALQILMTPVQLYESPLFQIHMMKSVSVKRPFPTPSPFGLPSSPEPEAPAVEEEAKAEKKNS